MSDIPDGTQQLLQRLERVEGHQARLREEVTAQLGRADVAVEDLVAAVEALRVRIEALESRGDART